MALRHILVLQLFFQEAIRGEARGMNNLEAQVRSLIFNGYNPRVRPVADSNKPVNVAIGLACESVVDIDLVEGVATLNLWLRASWYDQQLDWNASDYSGFWQLTATMDEVWTPDFLAYNHVELFEKEVRQSSELYVYSDQWGVYWSRPAVVRISFNVDASEFPYDTQVVELDIGSWSNSGFLQNNKLMNYTRSDENAVEGKRRVTNGEVDLSILRESSEWDITTLQGEEIISYYACCPTEPWPKLKFKMEFTRKHFFYMQMIMLPTIATTVVSFATFLLPHECGERIGLGITCLLVICAIMFVASDIIPVTDKSTVLGTFYSGCFIYTLVSLLVTVISAMLYYQTIDIDQDGESGSFMCVNILGISAEMALRFSFRVDLYLSFLSPLTFACFLTLVLNPEWSLGRQVLAVIVLVPCFVLVGALFLLCVYAFRRARGADMQHFTAYRIIMPLRSSQGAKSSSQLELFEEGETVEQIDTQPGEEEANIEESNIVVEIDEASFEKCDVANEGLAEKTYCPSPRLVGVLQLDQEANRCTGA